MQSFFFCLSFFCLSYFVCGFSKLFLFLLFFLHTFWYQLLPYHFFFFFFSSSDNFLYWPQTIFVAFFCFLYNTFFIFLCILLRFFFRGTFFDKSYSHKIYPNTVPIMRNNTLTWSISFIIIYAFWDTNSVILQHLYPTKPICAKIHLRKCLDCISCANGK